MAVSPISMQGQTVLVTGFTAGLGRAGALELAALGADLVGVCRNREKGEQVAKEIRAQSGREGMEVLVADLGDQSQVHRVAEEFLALDRPLHVLWNNAGLINLQRETTAEGLEMTFAVNHLGHFLLTLLLLERLRETGASRVVSTSSAAHKFGGPLDFDDLQALGNYRSFRVYGRSKLANILFTQELARREAESGLTANCYHPGFVASDFSKNNGWLARTLMTLGAPLGRSAAKGAQTGVYLCTSPEVSEVSGGYFGDLKPQTVGARVVRPGDSQKLWQASLDLTGLSG